MPVPYYDKARAAYGGCAQQSSYAESENAIVSFPRLPPSFPSFAVCTAIDGKLGGSLGSTSASTQCESESFLPIAIYDHS